MMTRGNDTIATFKNSLQIHGCMTKIHTRQKRLLGITSLHRKHRYFFTNVEAKKGYRSFETKEKAANWAKDQGLDMKTHEIYELQNGKKFQVRPIPRQ